MKLKRIHPHSATFFGVIVLVFTFLRGIIMWWASNNAPEFALQYGIPGGLAFLEIAIIIPIVSAAVYYVAMLLFVWIYNKVAEKHPISWDISK